MDTRNRLARQRFIQRWLFRTAVVVSIFCAYKAWQVERALLQANARLEQFQRETRRNMERLSNTSDLNRTRLGMMDLDVQALKRDIRDIKNEVYGPWPVEEGE